MQRPLGKRFVYFLIAALLLAQQGFALHALSHGIDALKTASAQGSGSDPRAPLGDRHRDLCLTYAQVAAGATPVVPLLVAPTLSHVFAAGPQQQHAAIIVAAYRSRAPPAAV